MEYPLFELYSVQNWPLKVTDKELLPSSYFLPPGPFCLLKMASLYVVISVKRKNSEWIVERGKLH